MIDHPKTASELYLLAGALLAIAHGHDTQRHHRFFKSAARNARLQASWHAGRVQPASIGIYIRSLARLRDLHTLVDTLAGRREITRAGRAFWSDQRELLAGLIDWHTDALHALQSRLDTPAIT